MARRDSLRTVLRLRRIREKQAEADLAEHRRRVDEARATLAERRQQVENERSAELVAMEAARMRALQLSGIRSVEMMELAREEVRRAVDELMSTPVGADYSTVPLEPEDGEEIFDSLEELEAEVAETAAREQREAIAFATFERYANVLRTERLIEVDEERLRHAEWLDERARALLDGGRSLPSEREQAALHLSEVRMDSAVRKEALAEARRGLWLVIVIASGC